MNSFTQQTQNHNKNEQVCQISATDLSINLHQKPQHSHGKCRSIHICHIWANHFWNGMHRHWFPSRLIAYDTLCGHFLHFSFHFMQNIFVIEWFFVGFLSFFSFVSFLRVDVMTLNYLSFIVIVVFTTIELRMYAFPTEQMKEPKW